MRNTAFIALSAAMLIGMDLMSVFAVNRQFDSLGTAPTLMVGPLAVA